MKLPDALRQPPVQAGVVIVSLLILVYVVAAIVDAAAPSPSGPRSSSLATSRQGIAAWAELLRSSGRRVEALRAAPSAGNLPDRGTVVVLDPDRVSDDEARALRRFAERGGRVVAGGEEPGRWVETLAGVDDLGWDPAGSDEARVLTPVPEAAGVTRVRTAGDGRWTRADGALPALGRVGDSLLLVTRAGRGSVALLADASPLQNRLLDRADNAALGLSLAGEGPVTFVESVHGYGQEQGLAALPARFQWALGLLALAVLALMVARGRRFGPPEAQQRELPPPRRAYVDALAATLARGARREEAVAPVRAAARARVTRRSGIPEAADGAALMTAGHEMGLDEAAARALADPIEGDEDVVAAGRALALLERKGR
jgi:hypothetical protein